MTIIKTDTDGLRRLLDDLARINVPARPPRVNWPLRIVAWTIPGEIEVALSEDQFHALCKFWGTEGHQSVLDWAYRQGLPAQTYPPALAELAELDSWRATRARRPGCLCRMTKPGVTSYLDPETIRRDTYHLRLVSRQAAALAPEPIVTPPAYDMSRYTKGCPSCGTGNPAYVPGSRVQCKGDDCQAWLVW